MLPYILYFEPDLLSSESYLASSHVFIHSDVYRFKKSKKIQQSCRELALLCHDKGSCIHAMARALKKSFV